MYYYYFQYDNYDNFDLDNIMLCPDLLSIEPPNLNRMTSEIVSLHLQMEKLTIEVNTQKLRLMIGRTKRHRLESNMKKIKDDLISTKQLIRQLQQDNLTQKNRIAEMNQWYEDKLTRVSTTAYRGLARIHHLLITFTPYIPMTAEIRTDVSQLNYELYRTVDQLKIPNGPVETSDI